MLKTIILKESRSVKHEKSGGLVRERYRCIVNMSKVSKSGVRSCLIVS